MGDIGNGYGSKWHLLEFLKTESRIEKLNTIIKNQTGLKGKFQWKFPDTEAHSTEYRGIDFLRDEQVDFGKIKKKWNKFWVEGRNPQNWDGVIKIGEGGKYILVEAKAHKGEIKSSCKAKAIVGGKTQIQEALNETKEHFDITTDNDWLEKYYQLANRLAFIGFLDRFDIEADLLYIYFLNGYEKNGGTKSKSVRFINEWEKAINTEYSYLGLEGSKAQERIHKIFIDVQK